MPGQYIAENIIPLGRDKATAPYAIAIAWGCGSNSKKHFDAADNTLKLAPIYADCAIRFEQNAVSKIWTLTIPSLLPSGSYLFIIRNGDAGSELDTDTDVSSIFLTWDKELQSIISSESNIFVAY
jgi:hypothetical protein